MKLKGQFRDESNFGPKEKLLAPWLDAWCGGVNKRLGMDKSKY